MINYIVLLFICVSVGCTISTPTSDNSNRRYEYSSLGQVKLITPSVKDPKSPNTYNQSVYALDLNHRLLVRSDNLLQMANAATIDKYFVMALEIYVDKNDLTKEELEKIQICPLSQDWLFLATWEKAHPFDKGKWNRPGGSFKASECINVTAYLDDPDITVPIANEKTEKSSERSQTLSDQNESETFNKIQFDITDWFLNNVKGKNINYGFTLISTIPLTVFGDQGAHSPLIKWSQPQQ